MTESVCPSNPDGHLWVLHDRWPWKDYDQPTYLVNGWLGRLICLLIPVLGWAFWACDRSAPVYKAIGTRERWYCSKCREWEERNVPFK